MMASARAADVPDRSIQTSLTRPPRTLLPGTVSGARAKPRRLIVAQELNRQAATAPASLRPPSVQSSSDLPAPRVVRSFEMSPLSPGVLGRSRAAAWAAQSPPAARVQGKPCSPGSHQHRRNRGTPHADHLYDAGTFCWPRAASAGSEDRRYTLTERAGVAWAGVLGTGRSHWLSSALVTFG
jgi:hypothetical protein